MCDTSEELREEGRQEVREEMRGLTEEIRKEGREEGREEGRAKGIAEEQARIIVNMLRNGLSMEQITAITDMSESAVLQCIKN